MEPLAHRAFLEGVPNAAFHATYTGQLLGLFLAFKAAQVNIICDMYQHRLTYCDVGHPGTGPRHILPTLSRPQPIIAD